MKHITISHKNVPRETFAEADDLIEKYRTPFEEYLNQLLWWNNRVNLVSRDVPRETIWQHIRHSMLLTQFEVFKNASLIVDAGTGGGLPGIPLAISHPKKHLVLNDIVTKKCLAMKQMVQKLGLENAEIVDGSIADLDQIEPFLLISKHAFKIKELYRMTAPLPWKNMVFYKGVDFENELDGIEESLKIESFDMSERSEFYQGKALVFITRN